MDSILLMDWPSQTESLVILIVLFLLFFGKDLEDFLKNN